MATQKSAQGRQVGTAAPGAAVYPEFAAIGAEAAAARWEAAQAAAAAFEQYAEKAEWWVERWPDSSAYLGGEGPY